MGHENEFDTGPGAPRTPRGQGLRRALATALALVAVAAWAVPIDVARLVAKQEPLLLGRYSIGIFAGLAVGSVLFLLVAGLLWSRRSLAECAALLALSLGSTIAGLAVVSAATREGLVPPRYLREPVAARVADASLRDRLWGDVMTRQPGLRWEIVRRDVPAPGRSYPNPARGHPDVPVMLTTDDRGLRNRDRHGSYDLVVAGDSFAEGSMVSDERTWWRLFGERSGLRVYNVGVSGLAPHEYLNNFAAFGLEAAPRTALFLVYEGNDFKAHRRPAVAASAAQRATPERPAGTAPRAMPDDAKGQSLRAMPAAQPEPERRSARRRFTDWLWKRAPVRARLERALVDWLAPIGAGPLPPTPGLDWMPAAVSAGGSEHHYALEPKLVVRHTRSRADFEASPDWTTNAEAFEATAALARERGIRLVFAFAPTKEHVILPLLRGRVPAEELRAFAAFKADELPPPARFEALLFERLDAQESVMRAFCAARGIEFASLTEPLRSAAGRGVPVYFTYDPHWTEEGHAVVAEALAARLAPPAAAAAPR